MFKLKKKIPKLKGKFKIKKISGIKPIKPIKPLNKPQGFKSVSSFLADKVK